MPATKARKNYVKRFWSKLSLCIAYWWNWVVLIHPILQPSENINAIVAYCKLLRLIYMVFAPGEHLWPRSYGLITHQSLTDVHNIRAADANGNAANSIISVKNSSWSYMAINIIGLFLKLIHPGETSTMENAVLMQAIVWNQLLKKLPLTQKQTRRGGRHPYRFGFIPCKYCTHV